MPTHTCVQTEKAKQLFVLTHNFNFYKLVRDWYAKANSNRAQKGKDLAAFFYVLETDNALPRCSQLTNANETLVRYHSEYHYIFSRLHQFREHESLSIEDSFLGESRPEAPGSIPIVQVPTSARRHCELDGRGD